MKKFYLLFKKELKEMLTPKLWIPFFAVIIVFFAIGSIASKQMDEQKTNKDSIVIADMDQSELSKASINAISQVANVINVSATNGNELIEQMSQNKVIAGLIIPQGFESNIASNNQASINTYALVNNFSVLSGKKFAVIDTSTAIVNNLVSDTLINAKLNINSTQSIKNPISANNFVSANGKTQEGSYALLLAYILSQTTTIPVVLFVVIVMASQMIAAAVATEKENKTLETLLSLPISRKAIVTSKMLAAGVVSLFMAGIYMIGIRSLNSGISGMASGINYTNNATGSQLASALGLKITTLGFIELGAILFLAILLALAIAMILGSFSEDAKSAQGIVAPLMILVMIPYFITLFMDVNTLSPLLKGIVYIIPFSYVFIAIPNILLSQNAIILGGMLYMLILFIIFVFIAAKIFSSDLILTMKLNFSKKKVKT